MKQEIIYMYSTPLFWENSDFILNEKENDFILNILYNEKLSEGVRISTDKNILKNKKLNRIKNFFIDRVNLYVKNVLSIKNEVIMTQSWLAKSDKKSNHHLHDHKGAFLSCVYYIKCNSGKLIINEGRSAIQNGYLFDYNIINYNSFNSQSFNFPVKTGDLIIFPGHLKHKSEQNEDNEDRIVLGANFFLNGNLGSDNDVTSQSIYYK